MSFITTLDDNKREVEKLRTPGIDVRSVHVNVIHISKTNLDPISRHTRRIFPTYAPWGKESLPPSFPLDSGNLIKSKYPETPYPSSELIYELTKHFAVAKSDDD